MSMRISTRQHLAKPLDPCFWFQCECGLQVHDDLWEGHRTRKKKKNGKDKKKGSKGKNQKKKKSKKGENKKSKTMTKNEESEDDPAAKQKAEADKKAKKALLFRLLCGIYIVYMYISNNSSD